jgi:hypothetical protein
MKIKDFKKWIFRTDLILLQKLQGSGAEIIGEFNHFFSLYQNPNKLF